MNKPITVAIAGLGNRGRETYAEIQKENPGLMRVTAVADPNESRLAEAAAAFGLGKDKLYNDALAMASVKGLADVMFVCTPDRFHAKPAVAALKNGYHLILEKPMAPTLEECREILAAAEESGAKTAVCHVLRYTPFYRHIKDVIESGAIGDVVSIQAIENVGYYHQAHSFVRGNWSKVNESSPMILQKCCHDMDVILWLAERRLERVSAFGGLYLFKPEMAPAGAAKRCLDGCAVKESCPYDAEKIYISNKQTGVTQGKTSWPNSILTANPTKETVMEALRTGPYGRCVYHCDNDVVDHMVVNLALSGGVTASLTMCAFTNKLHRHMKVMGTLGEIVAEMEKNIITVYRFGGEPEVIDVAALSKNLTGHGGGDHRMVAEFLELLSGGNDGSALTDVKTSMESHIACFMAEESRLNGGAALEV